MGDLSLRLTLGAASAVSKAWGNYGLPADKPDLWSAAESSNRSEVVRGWEATRGSLQTQPGYVDIALHQAVSPSPDFRFVNVGRWESPQAFQQAI